MLFGGLLFRLSGAAVLVKRVMRKWLAGWLVFLISMARKNEKIESLIYANVAKFPVFLSWLRIFGVEHGLVADVFLVEDYEDSAPVLLSENSKELYMKIMDSIEKKRQLDR